MNNFDYKYIFYYVPPLLILLLMVGYYLAIKDIPQARIPGNNNPKQIIKTENQAAVEAFNKNDFVTANKIIDGMLAADENDIQALLLKAKTLAQEASVSFKEKELGNQARKIAEKILVLDPNNKEALLLIGYTYEIQEDYKKAHETYDKLLKSEDNAEVFFRKGHSYDLQGYTDSAEEYYNKAISIDNNNVVYLAALNKIYVLKGKHEFAIENYKKLLTQTENSRLKAEILYSIGSLDAAQSEKYSKFAKESFSKGIEFDPTYPLNYVGLAKQKVLEAQTQNDKKQYDTLVNSALADLATSLKIYPYLSAARLELAIILVSFNQKEAALKSFDLLLQNIDKDITIDENTKAYTKILVRDLIKTTVK